MCMYMFHVNTPHNYNCPSIPSTRLFVVDPNSKISTNILRINVMLPGKMGHQNRVVVRHLISFTVRDSRVWRREMTSEAVYCTCVTRRSFPCKHHARRFSSTLTGSHRRRDRAPMSADPLRGVTIQLQDYTILTTQYTLHQ